MRLRRAHLPARLRSSPAGMAAAAVSVRRHRGGRHLARGLARPPSTAPHHGDVGHCGQPAHAPLTANRVPATAPRTADAVIQVADAAPRQQMAGLGAALTHSSAALLAAMSDQARAALLADLFAPDGGGAPERGPHPAGRLRLRHRSGDDLRRPAARRDGLGPEPLQHGSRRARPARRAAPDPRDRAGHHRDRRRRGAHRLGSSPRARSRAADSSTTPVPRRRTRATARRSARVRGPRRPPSTTSRCRTSRKPGRRTATRNRPARLRRGRRPRACSVRPCATTV